MQVPFFNDNISRHTKSEVIEVINTTSMLRNNWQLILLFEGNLVRILLKQSDYAPSISMR